jgi:ribonucleoside-diphosphate reductase alpha chain
MESTKHIVKKNQEIAEFDSQKIINSLLNANRDSKEHPFDPEKILAKIENYLEVILLNQESKLSTEQLRILITKILEEANFVETAKNYSVHQKTATPSIYEKSEIEKIIRFFNRNQTAAGLNDLFKQFSAKTSNHKLATEILHAFQRKQFLPDINILSKSSPFEQKTIILEDNLDSIFDGLKNTAFNYQNGITTNLNFSKLRPKNSTLSSSKGSASGPVSFIKIFISAFEALKHGSLFHSTYQQKIILNIDHPDLVEYLIFIKSQKDNLSNQNFNYLISLTPEFLNALQNDQNFELINPKNQEAVNLLNARNTLDLIFSTIKENNQLGIIIAEKNPDLVSEQNIISGTIILPSFADNKNFDQNNFKKALEKAEHYLTEIRKDLPENSNYKIRLNFMGLADLLINLEIGYSSLKCLELIREILSIVKSTLSDQTETCVNLFNPLEQILECSNGIEPLNQLIKVKSNLEGEKIYQVHPLLKNSLQQAHLNESEFSEQIHRENSLANISVIPTALKQIFQTKADISYEWSIKLQKTFEEIFSGVDKKIQFVSGFDLNQIDLNDFRSFNNLSFYSIDKPVYYNSEPNHEANFLIKVNQQKKRSAIQIQPPLFQIKKTEEILLPPIEIKENE